MTSAKRVSVHGQWSSRLAYILATSGAAVGLGSIWKFPYITGQNGGGAFILVYLLCIALVATPIMIAETMLGRRARRNPVEGMRVLAADEGARTAWVGLGILGVLAGFLILSYYTVIMGWAMAYIVRAGAGLFAGMDGVAVKAVFSDLTGDPERLLAWHTLAMVVTMIVVSRGVRGGIETATRWMMPFLLITMLILVGYGMNSGHFMEAVRFLFVPDFSALTMTGVVIALGHAFFTMSIGVGTIMAYGSYMRGDVSIGRETMLVVGADTAVSLLAGLMIFPIVFAYSLTPTAGPGLVFETLPIAFGNMPFGLLFGTLFFVLLTVAAWASAISLIEPAVAWLVENHRFTRVQASVLLGVAAWLLGLVTVFSFNIWSDVKILGLSPFGALDFMTANIMLPITALLIAVFAVWVMRGTSSRDELGMSPFGYTLWKVLTGILAPVGIVLILVSGLGGE
ncbi:MAG: sodium-dependent transporter [Halothiobacillaceae bacterium]|jgi:NSS family neurotransmitter:Na+ symporter|nr:MAG: sodium-dependent transporter [Halothiobacillaceae bacterium]